MIQNPGTDNSIKKEDLLFEIGCEELPTNALAELSEHLFLQMQTRLHKAEFQFDSITPFATPRRLALLISQLSYQQPSQNIERRGPAFSAAFTHDGAPTPAALGFARSNQVNVEDLDKLETNEGSWLIFRSQRQGQTIQQLIPTLISEAIEKLPIAKRMCWGALSFQFARPVQWLVLLYGSEVVPMQHFGLHSDRLTYGHRFMRRTPIALVHASHYAKTLKQQGFVIADLNTRKTRISTEVKALAAQHRLHAIVNPDLLTEVASITEWPVALLCPFDKTFLRVPSEALIAAMQDHQKAFPTTDEQGNLKPYFITVANLKSLDSDQVVSGNARVMRARLADADFFFQSDKRSSLAEKYPGLEKIIFQEKLGSLGDKVKRLQHHTKFLAEHLSVDLELANRAAHLAKVDLLSDMVKEFPELQGIMGYYYAQHDKESDEVAMAIREHLQPRFAEDDLPKTTLGKILAIADRIDTLIGIFGIGAHPTGEKDPFGLRRAAIGLLRILVEQQLDLDLQAFIQHAVQGFQLELSNKNVAADVQSFIFERLRYWFSQRGTRMECFNAVYAREKSNPLDFTRRLVAIEKFSQISAASHLASANKRVKNILQKDSAHQDESANESQVRYHLNMELLTESAEIALAHAIKNKHVALQPLLIQKNYLQSLEILAELREPVDHFFDKIMVNIEDLNIRQNRLALLFALQQLFLQVADISLLR